MVDTARRWGLILAPDLADPALRWNKEMWHWLYRVLSSTRAAERSPAADRGTARPDAAAVTAPPTEPAKPRTSIDDIDCASFVCWLLDMPAPSNEPLRPAEEAVLTTLDAQLAPGHCATELLSRAPAVIPQLLSALRQNDRSLAALAERVSKDLVLAAEVLRLARSAWYRGQGEVPDLAHAISAIGVAGVQSAIAKVVLRPLMDPGSGGHSRRAAARLWEHSTQKAGHCSRLAAIAGMDPFDGYLAGLLHNSGWIVALRAADRSGGLRWPWTGAFVAGLRERRDPLFGRIVGGWQITDALTELAAHSLEPGLQGSDSVLARLLLAADRQAGLDLLGCDETQVGNDGCSLGDEAEDAPTLVRRSAPSLVR